MKPDLLFLTPVVPAPGGNGLAMRAGLFLEALSAQFRVHLHVVEIFPSPPVAPPPPIAPSPPVAPWPPVAPAPPVAEAEPWLERVCAAIAVQSVAGREDPLYRMVARIEDPHHRSAARAGYSKPSLCRFATDAALAELQARYAAVRFAAVHISRLYMAPFARPYLEAPAEARPRCWLDLDDWESRTLRRLADLYAANGEPARAELERAEAAKYERMEDDLLGRFDAVCLASEADRAALARRHRSAALVQVPNAVRMPAQLTPKVGRGPFKLLFVGSMGYYPNEDAVRFFCREVLPRLRARSAGPVELVIAGTLPGPAVAALGELPEVTVTGAVPDLAPLYRDADVVIAPLRAGGGTRIKILEAFAHRRPVVATTIGAEGIEARHGEHLLIADGADALAAACAHLHQEPAFGAALAERAAQLAHAIYRVERVAERVRALAQPQGESPRAR